MKQLISVSGGKDSTATLLLSLELYPEETMAVFADTGNEHPLTHEYLDYLGTKTGVRIHRVKADFSDIWQRRIEYVRNQWPDTLRDSKPKLLNKKDVETMGAEPVYFKPKPIREDRIEEIVAAALSVLEKGPTGIPFLDLCILKGRFPSRRAQFCTQELKVMPIVGYTMALIERVGDIESWHGVRADESAVRASLSAREDKGGGYVIYRPLLNWSVDEVFALHKKHGVQPNPLYRMGMKRVGCMPCINCSKHELLEISKRYPEQVDRIEQWERVVAMASKRQGATFFHKGPVKSPGSEMTSQQIMDAGNIRKMVEWSQTQYGGRKFDIFSLFEEPLSCSSAYGLCE